MGYRKKDLTIIGDICGVKNLPPMSAVVQWDNGAKFFYSTGFEDKYQLALVPQQPQQQQPQNKGQEEQGEQAKEHQEQAKGNTAAKQPADPDDAKPKSSTAILAPRVANVAAKSGLATGGATLAAFAAADLFGSFVAEMPLLAPIGTLMNEVIDMVLIAKYNKAAARELGERTREGE